MWHDRRSDTLRLYAYTSKGGFEYVDLGIGGAVLQLDAKLAASVKSSGEVAFDTRPV